MVACNVLFAIHEVENVEFSRLGYIDNGIASATVFNSFIAVSGRVRDTSTQEAIEINRLE